MKESEINYLIEAAKRFYIEGGFDLFDNMDNYFRYILGLKDVVAVIIENEGFIVGVVCENFLHPHQKQCSELAFYIEPEKRGTKTALKLLREYINIAEEKDCDTVTMVTMEHMKDASKLYERFGFSKVETTYRRTL